MFQGAAAPLSRFTIHLHILASGSSGNAAIVEGPQTSILIDCGLSRRELLRRSQELDISPTRFCTSVEIKENLTPAVLLRWERM